MPQTFPNISNLRNYIDQFIIPNGNEEITGEIHNNVENGLLDFIVKSTLNYANAAVEAGGSTVTLSKGVTIFTAAPTFLYWTDNFYNEWIVVNRSAAEIPLNPGLTYVDQYGTTRTSIPASMTVHLAKMLNGSWAQINNIGGSGTDIPNEGDETDTIIVTPLDAFGRTISADLKISETAGNAVQVLSDGVYVPPSAADIPNEGDETASIEITTGGTLDRVISADLKISATAGNAASIVADGLYVDGAGAGSTNSFTGTIDS